MAFTNIDIFPYTLTFSRYDRPQYRQCQMYLPPGFGGSPAQRCGADAMVIVARTSDAGRRYEDAMCDTHAAPWRAGHGQPS